MQITASNDIVCPGSQAVLTATPGFDYYDWGDGPTESNQLTVNPVNDTQYTVKAIAPNGCISEQNYTVTIHPVYEIREEVNICPGDSASIFGNWEKTPGIYEKPFSSVNGCDSVVQITLNVFEVAPIDLLASKGIICKGETVTLTANNAFTDYSWSIPGQNVNIREISPDETSSYELTVTDENLCTSTDRLTITVVESEITEIPVKICKGDSVLIDQVWRKEPGIYIEKLQGSELCEGTIRYTVTYHETPELALEADNRKICIGKEVTITATPGWKNYQWNYGNSTGNSLSIIPENSGYITVRAVSENDCTKTDSIYIEALPVSQKILTHTICQTDSILIFDKWEKDPGEYTQTFINHNGCDSVVLIILEILPLPQPGLRADNLIICEDETINLVANEGLSNYLWSTGDQNVSTISVTPTQSVSYKVTVTSENGCQASDSLTISVIGTEITYRQVEICQGDSVQVVNKWFKSAGVYTEEFQTSTGCIGTMEITVVSNPVPDLILMSDKETVCEGNSVTLSASVGWDNYQWNGGEGSGAIFTTTPLKSGFVSLYASTAKGCIKTDSLFIQLFNSDHSELNYSVCESDSVLVFNTWIKTQGEYVYTYNNLNGCDSVVTATVEVLKLPETFVLSGEGEYGEEEPGRQIILEGSENGVQYRLFSTAKEESSLPGTGSTLDFGIWDEGQYWVVAENLVTNCLTLAGDTINISKTEIELPKEFRVYPNPAFAEVFVSTPAEGKLRIYNSKGQLVIHINRFSNKLINLSNLDQGIYLAVLQVYTEFYFTKFIKL